MLRPSVFLLVSLVIAAAGNAGTASGTFVLDDTTYAISSVLAKTDVNPFDSSKKDVLVLLTDVPVQASDFDVMTLDSLAESGKVHGILVRLQDARQATGLTVLGAVQRSGNFVCAFDSTDFDLDHVAGRVYLKEPDHSFGRKYTFDVEFDTEVKETEETSAAESPGVPLPLDGGEPGKAYREYEKAIQSGDPGALKKYLVPEQAKKLDEPQAANMLGLMKVMRAQQVKILEGFLFEDRATLKLEGKDPVSNSRTQGTAKMRKVNGQWVLERESWSSVVR